MVGNVEIRCRLRNVLFFALASTCLTPWMSSHIALSIGFLFAVTLGNPFPKATKLFSKKLLKICIVLLGFKLDLGILLEAGVASVGFTALTIAGTFAIGHVLGRLFKVPQTTSMLISAGTAICGGSAIAATSSVLGAVESEMSVALGTVFLLNSVALYIFAPLGDALHLTQGQFGVWAGLAIHDVSSVVGVASQFGSHSLETATVVKLSRSLWIIPVTLVLAYLSKQRSLSQQGLAESSRVQLPWFIGFFVLASLSKTLIPEVANWSDILLQISKTGFNLTLFAIGTGLSLQAINKVGWRTFAQGILLWLFGGLCSLWIVFQFGTMVWGVME